MQVTVSEAGTLDDGETMDAMVRGFLSGKGGLVEAVERPDAPEMGRRTSS